MPGESQQAALILYHCSDDTAIRLASPPSPGRVDAKHRRQMDRQTYMKRNERFNTDHVFAAAKKDRKNAKHSGGIAAAVTKQTAGKFV